jgi:putative hemolysin
VEWVDYSKSTEEIFLALQHSAYSKFVVGNGSLDNIKGVIRIKDFFENHGKPGFTLDSIMEQPILFPESISAFKILNLFKTNKQYIGLVIDEHGAMKGILTLHDLFEAIVGELPEENEEDDQYIVKRTDGSYLIDGRTLIYELNQFFQHEIIEDNIDLYTTISGFALTKLNHFPTAGERLEHENITIEIIDMDGTRIDKVLLTFSEELA